MVDFPVTAHKENEGAAREEAVSSRNDITFTVPICLQRKGTRKTMSLWS